MDRVAGSGWVDYTKLPVVLVHQQGAVAWIQPESKQVSPIYHSTSSRFVAEWEVRQVNTVLCERALVHVFQRFS